jgi:anti-sigma factor RsiW
MSRHTDEARRQAYADGSLESKQIPSVERHLAVCDECRADVAALRDLLGQLSALDRSVVPASDLRADLWRRIDDGAPGIVSIGEARRARLGQRTLGSLRWPLVAAALVLITVTSVITANLVGRATPGGDPPSPVAGVDVSAVEAHYVAATIDLERIIREQGPALAPSTMRLVQENLRVIDQALAEARDALAADPGNADLSRMLLAAWEKKLDLLRSATRSSTGVL